MIPGQSLRLWDAVNGVNLAEHILPSRANAHLIITKGRDHNVTRLEWRSPQIGPTPR